MPATTPHQRILVTRATPGIDAALAARLPDGWTAQIGSDDPLPRQDLLSQLGRYTAVIVHDDIVDEEFLDSAPQLRVVVKYGVGLDNVDLAAAARRGVTVRNLPSEVTYATAELTIGLILACSRRIVESDRWLRANNPFPWTPTTMLGRSLPGKTLGLIGFGRIGQCVARLGSALGLEPVYTARTRRPDAEDMLGAKFLSLPELLGVADIVSLHVPGGDATRHLLGPNEFATMKPSAVLINTSRGSVVDEQALVRTLQQGRLTAAGLDVFAHEPGVDARLCQMNNVILTPHIGTSTAETRQEMTNGAVSSLLEELQAWQSPRSPLPGATDKTSGQPERRLDNRSADAHRPIR